MDKDNLLSNRQLLERILDTVENVEVFAFLVFLTGVAIIITVLAR
jgi:hypothetical protein